MIQTGRLGFPLPILRINHFYKNLFKSECSLTGKTVYQEDNQSALIIRKGRYKLHSSTNAEEKFV